MSYDRKFKKRAIEYLGEGHTYRETAKVFGIAKSALQRWEKEGIDKEKVMRFRRGKIDRERLAEYLKEHPDAYQTEIAKEFSCTQQAISVALKRYGYTRKKR